MGEQEKKRREEEIEIEARRSDNSFPLDIISEVLLRLPSKSVAKSQCVSKLFNSITSQPCFIRSFAARSSQSPPCLLFVLEKDSNLIVFSIPQQQQKSNNPPPVAVLDSSSYSMPIQEKYCFLQVESVHGLICVMKSGNPQIWNPTTRRFSSLPKPASRWKNDTVSFIGYDPIDGTYKVLSMHGSRPRPPRALTLGAGAGWRVIEGVSPHTPFLHGARCVNGVVYYLAAPCIGDIFSNQHLVSFHVRSEKFSIIKVPWNLTPGLRSLAHYEGKLVCVITRGDGFTLWTLEDLEKQEWSYKYLTLPFPWLDPISRTRFSLYGVNDAGEFIFVTLALEYPFHIIYFDPKGHSFRRVVIDGVALDQFRRSYGFGDDQPLRAQCAYLNHIETLMSI